jgi:hypothetical protein
MNVGVSERAAVPEAGVRAADGNNQEWMERLYLRMQEDAAANATEVAAMASD